MNMKDDLVIYGCGINAFGVDYKELQKLRPNEFMYADFEYIHRDINDINKSFVRLAFHLYELKSFYRKGMTCGFSDFHDLCKVNFGLDNTQVSRLIGICDKFMRPKLMEPPKIFLNEEYKDYSYSQLCEMLPMKHYDLLKVKPDMTVKDIRELKKKIKENAIKKICDVATGDPDIVPEVPEAASEEPKKNYLSMSDYVRLSGASLASKIKKADSLQPIHVTYYSDKGKIIINFNADVLIDDHGELVLRDRNIKGGD